MTSQPAKTFGSGRYIPTSSSIDLPADPSKSFESFTASAMSSVLWSNLWAATCLMLVENFR